jgi:hypothetical protein
MRELHDPNFPQRPLEAYDNRAQIAGVAVILLLLAGLFIASSWTSNETQTASNTPASETTGSASPIPTQPMR